MRGNAKRRWSGAEIGSAPAAVTRFEAVGTGGAYTGLKGVREWHIEGPAGPDVLAHVRMVLS